MTHRSVFVRVAKLNCAVVRGLTRVGARRRTEGRLLPGVAAVGRLGDTAAIRAGVGAGKGYIYSARRRERGRAEYVVEYRFFEIRRERHGYTSFGIKALSTSAMI